jgi:signal transduction histidine kinase
MIVGAANQIEALAGWADDYLTNPDTRSSPQLEYRELRLVGEAFDNLVSRLDMALGEIEKNNQELAALVAKKTGELVERGQVLDTIVSEMPQCVFLLEPGGVVLYANAHSREDFSVSPGDRLPTELGELVAKLGGEPTDFVYEHDGRDFLIHSRLVEGQSRRLVLAMDVTDRRVMEEQLYQTQKMESVSRLAGGVAHDFNNALAAIIPSVDMLRLKISDEKAVAYVDNIEKAALRGADVVRKLLAFSRAGTYTPRPLILNEVIEGAIKVFKPTAKYAEIVWQPGENLPKVHGDEAQLQQLIFNLGINSLDASDGRCKITIKTWTDQSRQSVFITLTDDGPGVSSEIADHIFEPFFTTKKQTQLKTQGTGLGLAVAYGVVDRHGGRIRLLSGSKPGAVFEIELPAWVDTSGAKGSTGSSSSRGDIVIGGK